MCFDWDVWGFGFDCDVGVFGIVIYNKKYIFGLHCYFWHKTPQSLGTLQMVRVVEISMLNIFGLLSSVAKIVSGHKAEMAL